MSNSTENTINDVVQALEGLVAIAPSIIAIVNTIKTNGSITLDEMNQLMATRKAAVAEADQKLGG
jgi:hypothetical protein